MRKILLFTMVVFFSFNSNAQEKAFQFGFELSPNIGWVSPKTENYENEGVRIGFSWGLNGDIYLLENYAINTGLKFIYLNGNYSFPESRDNTLGRTQRKLHSNYIQIPGVLRMRTQEITNGLSIYGDFGVAMAFRINSSADEKFYVNNNLFGDNKKKDVDNELRFTRTSMIVGAGVYKELAESTKLNIGLRLDNGFSNILKGRNNVTNDKIKGRMSFVELKIGVLF